MASRALLLIALVSTVSLRFILPAPKILISAPARARRGLEVVKLHRRLVAPLMLLGRARSPDLVPAALRAFVGLALKCDQEAHAPQHAPDGGIVGQLARLVHAAEAQGFDGGADLGPRADGGLHEGRLEGFVSHRTLRSRPAARLP